MAGEVIALQKQVVDRAWDGAQELARLIALHENQPSGVLEEAKDEKYVLDRLRRRALAAADYFTLTDDEAETLGSIADRSFYDEWQADFKAEYGVGE